MGYLVSMGSLIIPPKAEDHDQTKNSSSLKNCAPSPWIVNGINRLNCVDGQEKSG